MYRATVFTAVLMSLTFSSWEVQADEFPKPELIPIAVEDVFTPHGFDDNDDSQIVLAGNLPSTCHKVGPTKVQVDRERKKILLSPQAYFYTGCWCAQVQVPFTLPLNLGLLPAGAYEIQVLTQDGSVATAGLLPVIASANVGPDDYLYAPVKDAIVRGSGFQRTLLLRGEFTNTCMHLQSVKVSRGPSNVLVVQPIAEFSGSGCRDEARPYEVKVALPTLAKGRHLVHVRSLNGQAVNATIDSAGE